MGEIGTRRQHRRPPGKDAQLENLVIRQAIHDAHMRYFRGVDRCDSSLINSAFHADAILKYGPNQVRGDAVGQWLVERMRPFTATLHASANEHVEIDGDVAFSETYSINQHLGSDHDGEFILERAIRYVDQFYPREGHWKIAHRTVICEWDRVDRITRSSLPPFQPALRSREDVSYERKRAI